MCAPGSACSSSNQAAQDARDKEHSSFRLQSRGKQPQCAYGAPGSPLGTPYSVLLHTYLSQKYTHHGSLCTLALEGFGWAGAAPVSRAPEGGVVATWQGIGLAEVGHARHTHGHDQLGPRQLLVVQQRRPAGGDTGQEGRAGGQGSMAGALMAGANGAGRGEERRGRARSDGGGLNRLHRCGWSQHQWVKRVCGAIDTQGHQWVFGQRHGLMDHDTCAS